MAQPCRLWPHCELVRDYVKKGTKLFIEGKIETRSWEQRDGREALPDWSS